MRNSRGMPRALPVPSSTCGTEATTPNSAVSREPQSLGLPLRRPPNCGRAGRLPHERGPRGATGPRGRERAAAASSSPAPARGGGASPARSGFKRRLPTPPAHSPLGRRASLPLPCLCARRQRPGPGRRPGPPMSREAPGTPAGTGSSRSHCAPGVGCFCSRCPPPAPRRRRRAPSTPTTGQYKCWAAPARRTAWLRRTATSTWAR